MVVVVVFLQLQCAAEATGTVILFAKEAVRAKGKFITRYQLFVACHAAKALQVENLVLGSHDEVAGTKGAVALFTLGAKEPATGVVSVCFIASKRQVWGN